MYSSHESTLRRRSRTALVRSLLLTLLTIGGCREQPPAGSDALQQSVQSGAFTLTLTTAPPKVRVGDRVAIRLRVDTPDQYEVRFVDADAIGVDSIRPSAVHGPQPGATGLVWTREFEFDPRTSGDLHIPSLTVVCTPLQANSAAEPVELHSDAFTIAVRSALTAADDPRHPRGVTAPLLPAAPPWAWWQWALLFSLPVALAAVAIMARRALRRPPPPVPLLSPAQWARQALTELDPATWLARGDEREYYYRLSEVIRRYIERQFGLAAPEMTTDEFFASLTRAPGALSGEGERLRAFLRACDLVKYAAVRPGVEPAQAAWASAQAFVEATAAESHAVEGRAA